MFNKKGMTVATFAVVFVVATAIFFLVIGEFFGSGFEKSVIEIGGEAISLSNNVDFWIKSFHESLEIIAKKSAYDLGLVGGIDGSSVAIWSMDYPRMVDLFSSLNKKISRNLPRQIENGLLVKFREDVIDVRNPLATDVNVDGIVDGDDLSICISYFGKSAEAFPFCNIYEDDVIDGWDLIRISSDMGKTSELENFTLKGKINIIVEDDFISSTITSRQKLNSSIELSYLKLLSVGRQIFEDPTYYTNLESLNLIQLETDLENDFGIEVTIVDTGTFIDVSLEDRSCDLVSDFYCIAPIKPGEPGIVNSDGNPILHDYIKLNFRIRKTSLIATAACSDGIDNDGDISIDLFDPGCVSPTDDSECGLEGESCAIDQCCDGLGLSCKNDICQVPISGLGYVATGQIGDLKIVNISDPTNPTLVGTIVTPGVAFDVYVSGDYAYVADGGGGLNISDVFDPTNPIYVGSIGPGGDVRAVYVSGDYAYLADASNGLRIVDVSDPSNHVIVGNLAGALLNDVYVSGQYAYLAHGTSGFRIVNVADPTNPTLVSTILMGINVRDVHVSGDYAYLADNNGLKIVDISDKSNPTVISSVATPTIAEAIFLSGTYAYLLDETNGLVIVDVSDPNNPVISSTLVTGGNGRDIHVSGDYAYVAELAFGVQIIDVSDPSNPVIVGNYNGFGPERGVFIPFSIPATLPSSFDWRNHLGINWMTDVRTQGCNDCWVFSTLGPIEAKYNIQENDETLDIDLSEQYLVSDCYALGDCGGGTPAFDYVKNSGVVDEICYPYIGADSSCGDRCADWNTRIWRISDHDELSDDPATIKYNLINKGPLFAAMYMQFWSAVTYTCPAGPSDHGVVIVGYNDTEGVWIIRNSWGPSFQDGGYFKVAYGNCNIEDDVTFIEDVIIKPCSGDEALNCTVPSLPNPGDERLWGDNDCGRKKAKIDCDGIPGNKHVCDINNNCVFTDPSISDYSVSDTLIDLGESFTVSVNGNCPTDFRGKCMIECRVIHPDGHFIELDTWDEDGTATLPSVTCDMQGDYVVDYCIVVTDYYDNSGWGGIDNTDTTIRCGECVPGNDIICHTNYPDGSYDAACSGMHWSGNAVNGVCAASEVCKEGSCELVDADITSVSLPIGTYTFLDTITIDYTIQNTGDIAWTFLTTYSIGAAGMSNWDTLSSGTSTDSSLTYDIPCGAPTGPWFGGLQLSIFTDDGANGGWRVYPTIFIPGLAMIDVVECLNDADCLACGITSPCNLLTNKCGECTPGNDIICHTNYPDGSYDAACSGMHWSGNGGGVCPLSEVCKEGSCELVDAVLTSYDLPGGEIHALSDTITIDYTIQNTGDIAWTLLTEGRMTRADGSSAYTPGGLDTLNVGASTSGSITYDIGCTEPTGTWDATIYVYSDYIAVGGWNVFPSAPFESFTVVQCLNDADCLACGITSPCNLATNTCGECTPGNDVVCHTNYPDGSYDAACSGMHWSHDVCTGDDVCKEGSCELVDAVLTSYDLPGGEIHALSDTITMDYTIQNTGDITWSFLTESRLIRPDGSRTYSTATFDTLNVGASTSGSVTKYIGCGEQTGIWDATLYIYSDYVADNGWNVFPSVPYESFTVVDCLNNADCITCLGNPNYECTGSNTCNLPGPCEIAGLGDACMPDVTCVSVGGTCVGTIAGCDVPPLCCCDLP